MCSTRLYQVALTGYFLIILGCSGSSSTNPTIQPPTSLSYATNPAVYIKDVAITANIPSNSGGAVTSYSVSPPLPAGVSLNTTTGVIGGTPTVASQSTGYAIVASNSMGSTTCVLLITVAPTPLTLSKAAGDGQTSSPGTVLAIAPDVAVFHASGTPAVDVDVTFTVTAGGGSVLNAHVRTNASGHASCGAWTLGVGKGLNIISATVAGLNPVTFTSKAETVSNEVSLSVLTPISGSTVNETVTVIATATSTYQLSKVTASINGTFIQLAYGPYGNNGSNAWKGTLSLVGQPRGLIGLVVTATDVFSNSTDAVVSVMLDQYPKVTVASPLDGSVARPKVDLVAFWSDDDPAVPVSLTVSINGKVIASGKNSISQQVDLSAYEGQSVSIDFIGVDSIGQRTTVTRNIYVESSARLSVMAEVNGQVWDVSGNRILFLDTSGTIPALKILDTDSGVTQTIETSANLVGTWGCYGYLTPTGAIYVRGENPTLVYPYSWLFEWRGGILTNLAGLNSAQSLRVSGNWAVYNTPALWSRDLSTGISSLITADAGNIYNDVATNGDIAYWTNGYQINRWRNGSTLAMTSDTLWNTYPVTDGLNVVYRKHNGPQNNSYRIAVHDGLSEIVLAPTTETEPLPGSSYLAAGGYVVYVMESVTKLRQIWRHSPSGESQLTFFGSSSSIDSIGPDGTVLLTHSPKRYQVAIGGTLQEVGSNLGRVIYRDGKFLIVLGRIVFELVP